MTGHGVKAYSLSGKEVVSGAALSKEGYDDSHKVNKQTNDYWFP